MAEPGTILESLSDWFKTRDLSKPQTDLLSGVSVLITAGPTQEKIDPVRYISNHSSGKMGFALAKYCQQQGGNVCLIAGPSVIDPPNGVELIPVISTAEMHQEVMKRADQTNLIIKSAAVSDYRVDQPHTQKIKKTNTLSLNLVKNPDILKELGRQKTSKQFLVGFAAESENLVEYAKKKLHEKNLDLIVANNILEEGAGFNVDTNRVHLIDQECETALPTLSKDDVAKRILDYIISSKKWQSIKQTILP